jgi:hypothetical protein
MYKFGPYFNNGNQNPFYIELTLPTITTIRSIQFQIQVSDSDLNMKRVNCRVQNVSFQGINVIVKDIHFQTIAHLTKLYFNF